MNDRKLGIFLWYGYRIPVPERIRQIREAGFETVLHWWDDSFREEEGLSKEEQACLIRSGGLTIENAHLQFDRANDLWLDTLDGQALLERYLSDLDGLAEFHIPVAVLHPTRGFAPPPVTEAGLKRIRLLVDRAEKRNVRMALENVRNNQTLVQLLDTLPSPMLGLCYDSGHDFVWSGKPYDLLKRYGDRLFAVHLHDNRGREDEHLPIGEGDVNWETVRQGIGDSAYAGSFTLEGDSAVIPPTRTPQEHLKLLYEGAGRLLSGFPGEADAVRH